MTFHLKATRKHYCLIIALFTFCCLLVSPALSKISKRSSLSTSVSILDVGHGSAILIQLPHNKNILIDGGGSGSEHFNIGEIGSYFVPYSQWESMRMGLGHTKYNAWNHYPFGLLPSDGTVATGIDRVSSSCILTLYGPHHLLDDGRTDMYNIYGITDLPASELKNLNRSWNYAPELSNLSGAESKGFDKGQRAYVLNKTSKKTSFSLDGSEDSPIVNPCFVIKNWGSDSKARIKINNKNQAAGSMVKQGIIRDTDGTLTLVIWISQESDGNVSYDIT